MIRSIVVAEIHAAAASAPRDTGRAQGRMPRLHRVPRADADGLNRSVVGKHQHEVLAHGAEGADVWRVSEARRGGGAATPTCGGR
jgi:hypothetical protein